MLLTVIASVWLIMSIYTFCVYAYDKKIAGTGKRRIPEKQLLLLALLMGAPGAFVAMQRLRHKTLHRQFTVTVPVCLIAQTALILYIAIKSI